MFGPNYTAGCPSCSAIADGFSGSVAPLGRNETGHWWRRHDEYDSE